MIDVVAILQIIKQGKQIGATDTAILDAVAQYCDSTIEQMEKVQCEEQQQESKI